MTSRHKKLLFLILLLAILAVVCFLALRGANSHSPTPAESQEGSLQSVSSTPDISSKPDQPETPTEAPAKADEDLLTVNGFSIPAYSGSPNVEVNNNRPFFTEDEITDVSFETYGDLDELGRCTTAFACVGPDLMPDKERERISEVKPTGWRYDRYDGIEGDFLYNRCHLIAYGLTAENANRNNLITGTRYMNTSGMNDIENDVINYIRYTGNHVMYRVTPVFTGDELVARGVLMEGLSVEDDEICYCIFAYNVQPGITIDYATGKSSGNAFIGIEASSEQPSEGYEDPGDEVTYVINTNSGKFHRPDCEAVWEMNQRNRMDVSKSRQELLAEGYEPCGSCRP